MASASSSAFKILLVGDQGVGKTTLLHRHLTGLFNSGYTATSGVEVQAMHFNTNYGDITLNIYDVGAVEKGVFEQVCVGADGLFLMFDVMKQASYNNLGKWKQDVAKVAGNLPTVVCGNKVDCKGPIVKSRKITFQNKNPDTTYYHLSVKATTTMRSHFCAFSERLQGIKTSRFSQKRRAKLEDLLVLLLKP